MLADKNEERMAQMEAREQQNKHHKEKFNTQYQAFFTSQNAKPLCGKIISDNLMFWVQHLSWTYCRTCKLMKAERILPNYTKRLDPKFAKRCQCTRNDYLLPTI